MNGKPKDDARGMGKHRIEALADGIFAVAMTLLVLDIKSPENLWFDTDHALAVHLAGFEHSFVMYAISFVVLGIFLFCHHVQLHFVHRVDRRLLWTNLLFLLFVVLIPFSTDLLGDHGHLQLPVVIYAVNLLVLVLLLYLHLRYLVANPRLAVPELTPEAVTLINRQLLLLGLVPACSIAVSFHSPRLGMYLYTLLVVPVFLSGRIDQLTRGATEDDDPAR
jgi:uncharacterized membrane protein